MKPSIQALEAKHWPIVASIYQMGLETRLATFETSVPNWEKWDESHLPHSRFVAIINDEIVGWAALSPVSDRCVYGGVAEVSVYISPNLSGKGIGSVLLQELIASSEKEGIWTLTAAMFPENMGSVKLHEKHGFRRIGYREKIGKLDGVWRNTFLYEKRNPNIS